MQMRGRFGRCAGAAFLVAGVAARRAHAETTDGFAIDRFEPSDRGGEWFSLDSLDRRGHGRLAAGAVLDWGYRPLVVYDAAGNLRRSLIRNQVFTHVGASLILWDTVRIGASLPIAVYQEGKTGVINGVTYQGSSDAAVGDLRLSVDTRLIGAYQSPFSLALGLQLWVPTGDRSAFTSDGAVRFAPTLEAAGDLGPLAYAARIGVMMRSLRDTYAGAPVGTELPFGIAAGLRAGGLLIGPELYGSTVVVEQGAFKERSTPVEALLGAHYTAGIVRLGAGAGVGLTRGLGSPETRGLFSLEIIAPATAPKDTDGDGIIDERDACPAEPGVGSEDPKKNGCPLDGDHDGISDGVDACPMVPGVANADPKQNGCPPDQDGDGIADSADACPTVPGVANEDPKLHGCPADRDRDGIADSVDACIDVAGVASDDPKQNGCPPDRDGDGIVDSGDACPDAAGPASDDPKRNGCPDKDGDNILDKDDACPDAAGKPSPDPKKNGCPAVVMVKDEIRILEQVKFATNSARILGESDEILRGVATMIKEHPEIQAIRVEGHTDNTGAKAHNLKLSKQRAASVVTWLVKSGAVDAKRLVSDGYGDSKPIDSNATEDGRKNNRRVEFHIVKKEGDAPAVKSSSVVGGNKPTGAHPSGTKP